MGEKEKRMSKKNVDGRSASSHDKGKFRTRSMEKQRGMSRKCVIPDVCVKLGNFI